jgi:glycine oxidase
LVTGELQTMHRASLAAFPAFAREIKAATGIDVGYECHGRIEIICDDKQQTRCAEECKATPVMQVLTPDELQELEPAVEAGAFGGQLCLVSAQVAIGKLVTGLRAACRAAGVEIHEHLTASGLRVESDRVMALQTSDGELSAARFLIAAGAWTAQLHQALAQAAPIKPVRGQGILLETDRPLIGRIIKKGKVYLVPWGRQILVGSTTEPAAGFDCSTTAEGIAMLRAGAAEIVPALAGAELVRAWAGLRPDGPKHRPVIGPVAGLNNLYVAAGHFKIGIGMAPGTAAAVVALMGHS